MEQEGAVADRVHVGALDAADRLGDGVGVAGVDGVAGEVDDQQVGVGLDDVDGDDGPADSPTAVVMRPMPSGSAPRWTRMVIE